MPRNLARLLLRSVVVVFCVALLTGATFVVSRYVSNRRLMTLCKIADPLENDVSLGMTGTSPVWLERWIGADTARAMLCQPTELLIRGSGEQIADSTILQILQASSGLGIIAIPYRDLPEGSLELIATQHRAQRFRFRLPTIRPDDARWLSKLTQLKHVEISQWVREPRENDWTWLQALPGLERLNVIMLGASDQDLFAFAQCAATNNLSLSGHSISDDAVCRLCDLPRLQTLELEGRGIRLKFATGQKLPSSLKTLELRSTSIDNASLTAIAGLPQLKRIKITSGGVTDAGMETLAGLSALRQLSLADLQQLTDEGLKTLARSASLIEVHIASCGTTPTGLVHLNELPNWVQIRFDHVKFRREPGTAKPILTPDNVTEYLSSQWKRQQPEWEDFSGPP